MDKMETEEAQADAKDVNALWMEQIIKNYLVECPPTPESERNPEEPQPSPIVNASVEMEVDAKISTSQKQEKGVRENDVCVIEIEMRDEGFDSDIESEVPAMSRLINARIKYAIGKEDEERFHFWIIKIPTPFLPNREVASYAGLYKREVSFYVDILPLIKAWVELQNIDTLLEFQVPNCYYGKYNRVLDPEPDPDVIERLVEAESVVILQDLRPFDFGKRNFGQGLSTAEALAAITEITKFHAVSHAMQKKEGMTLGFPDLYSPQGLVDLYVPLFKRGAKTFENFMSNCTSEAVTPAEKALMCTTVKQMEANIRDFLPVLFEPSEIFPSTLIHMDLWSDNLLFRIKEEDRKSKVSPDQFDLDCVIIDWQMASYGHPTHDLALLMMISMDAPTRKASTQDLLIYYYQYFGKILESFELPMPFTFEALVSNFQSSCVLALVMAIASMDLVIQDENAQTRLLLLFKDLFDEGIIPVYSASETKSSSNPVTSDVSYIS